MRFLWLLLCVALAGSLSCSTQDDPRVRGVVVAIESAGLNRIRQFTLQDEGRRFTILVDENTNFAFAPGHLSEHRVTGEPVAVEVERRNGRLYALSVDDA